MWHWRSRPRAGGTSSGWWAGDGSEGAKHWMHILTAIKNRGVNDVLMLACDELKGLPDAVETVWPRTIVQTCVVHLLRNSFRYAAAEDFVYDSVGALTNTCGFAYTPTRESLHESQGHPHFVELPQHGAWSAATTRFRPDLSRSEARARACPSLTSSNVRKRGTGPKDAWT